MKLTFLKDQKWVIDQRTVVFKEGETKDIKKLSIAKEMIENGYAVSAEDKEEEVDKEEKAVDNYEDKSVKPKDKKGRPKK